uniref:Uncharacterized protein n=1 Tax=Rhizophora mucronata TaxID=61149 RepID=A0A2P2K8P3_RHIMU
MIIICIIPLRHQGRLQISIKQGRIQRTKLIGRMQVASKAACAFQMDKTTVKLSIQSKDKLISKIVLMHFWQNSSFGQKENRG